MADELLMEKSKESMLESSKNNEKTKELVVRPYIWANIILLLIFHIGSAHFVISHSYKAKFLTLAWIVVVGWTGIFGVTAGAHRLWTHHAYKAKLPLKLILLGCFSIAGQNTLFHWVRNHRIHHKFSDTDADPFNAQNGFFYSHMGWLIQRRHPETKNKRKLIDMSDITDDPLLAFHTKYYLFFMVMFSFVIPSIIPVYFWNESWYYSILSQVFLRYMLNLNITFSVNSVAHFWGNKPYDK